jgi:Ca2+-binding EF-hand superfamily protein
MWRSASTFFIVAFMVVLEQLEHTDEILGYIHRQALARGLRVSEFFRDHDKLRTGHCSVTALKSALTRLNVSLTEDQLNTIVSRFGNSSSCQFGYRSFLEELARMHKSESASSKTDRERHVHNAPDRMKHEPHTWARGQVSAISLLQAQVYERRVDFWSFFRDFDPLRKGCVSESNLRCALTLLNFEVTEDEIGELVSSYGTAEPPKCIDYQSLCSDVECALQCPPMEKHPLELPPPNFDLKATKEVKKAVLNQVELASLREIESTIRRRVTQRDINLLGHFRSYDNHGRLVITGNQFARVLATLGFDIHSSEIELLCKKYCISGATSRFAYREFCDSKAS